MQAGVSLEEALKAFKAGGFSLIDYEIRAWELDQTENNAERLKNAMDACGLSPSIAHAPMPNHLEANGVDCVDLFTRSLKYCKIAGIEYAVIHPGALPGNTREAFFDLNAQFYRSLIPAAEDTGVGVLIENIGNYDSPYFLKNGSDLRELIDRVDHPLFTACFDTGHANLYWPEDGNMYDSVTALKGKLTALHVNDNCGYFSEPRLHGRIDFHAMPYFSLYSSVNYDALLQGLIDIGYTGAFNFEALGGYSQVLRTPFIRNGKEEARLKMPPLSIWTKISETVYEIGKYMLSEYGLFEE